jgi:hypothetical protein
VEPGLFLDRGRFSKFVDEGGKETIDYERYPHKVQLSKDETQVV